MNVKTNDFYIHLHTLIQGSKLNVNTQTQSLFPTIQSGLHLDIVLPNQKHTVKFSRNSQRAIPTQVWKNIQEKTVCTLTYIIPESQELIKKRTIAFIIAIQEACDNKKIKEINDYVRRCLTWLYIAQKNARQNKCNSSPLIIYLLFSPLTKILPSKNKKTIPVIDWENANTAFTTLCNDNMIETNKSMVREIVIYRKEEWFKVFIHETFHNFGFDFSNQSEKYISFGTLFILKEMCPVNSDVNLYEAYTECWARIISIAFACANNAINTDARYIQCVENKLTQEISWAFFQLSKVLEYMGISYNQLISGKAKEAYQERTSILAYYMLSLVLFSNYNAFIDWSCPTKTSESTFKLSDYIIFCCTKSNLESFCMFLQNNFKNPEFVKKIKRNILDIKSASSKQRNTDLYKTMRMTFNL
ncbi:hypothetical protein N9K75_00795 [bacterium]|nr:hypothetical protein [bacterium]